MNTLHTDLLESISDKKAIIWDFDGVFLFGNWHYGEDFNRWWMRLWQLLETFESTVTDKFSINLSDLRYAYEHTDYIARKYGERALEAINAFYLEKEMLIADHSELNEELVDLFHTIDPHMDHFIWSNNQAPFVIKALEKAGILDKFTEIVTRDKVVQAKPNMDGYEILRPYVEKHNSEDLIFVGDSENTDMKVAEKMGIDFFLYD